MIYPWGGGQSWLHLALPISWGALEPLLLRQPADLSDQLLWGRNRLFQFFLLFLIMRRVSSREATGVRIW